MKQIQINPLCLVGAFILFAACNEPVVDVYDRLKDNFAERSVAQGRLLGKSGDATVSEGDFLYSDGNRVVDADGLKSISEGVRRLYIKKYLLRKLAIERGVSDDIYDSPEAAAFILPRLEKIMEEYYYHHEGKFGTIAARTKKELRPDDAALDEFMKKNPAVKKAGADREQVEAEADRILGRVAEMRMSRERQKIIERLIKDSPPMEIFP